MIILSDNFVNDISLSVDARSPCVRNQPHNYVVLEDLSVTYQSAQ
jgi:hypothetical protein